MLEFDQRPAGATSGKLQDGLKQNDITTYACEIKFPNIGNLKLKKHTRFFFTRDFGPTSLKTRRRNRRSSNEKPVCPSWLENCQGEVLI